jgi:GTP cyclohydrolase I
MQQGMESFLRGVGRLAGDPALPRGARRRGAAQVVNAWQDDLLAGYGEDVTTLLAPLSTRMREDLVAVRDLEFASVCRHHLLPFTGRVHLAYAPSGRITGLSRLSRLVDCLSRRLQLQESLTREVAEAIQAQLAPDGAACVIEATHACMTMRGSRRHGRIVTAAFTGSFRRSAARRREVTALLLSGRGPADRSSGRRVGPRGRRRLA